MFTKFFNLFITVFLLLASFTFAQDNKWSVALISSYFGDQAGNLNQITAIDKPISLVLQLQYLMRSGVALKYSVESLNGATKNAGGNELNVQSSFAIVGYPFEVWRFRPFLVQGVLWGQQNNNLEAKSKSSLYYELGIGTEFALSEKVFNSLAAKLYSNGWNYHGWSTALSLGFRF